MKKYTMVEIEAVDGTKELVSRGDLSAPGNNPLTCVQWKKAIAEKYGASVVVHFLK